jgi:type IV pilus assembly protein PilE
MEVVIVVAIIGILLAVALPSYQGSLLKGRRSDGMTALLDATNRQESLMLDRSTYTADMTDLGFAADPYISPEGHYSIDALACGTGTIATCYVLTATPVSSSPQSKDSRCTTLILDSFGAKTATGSAPTECW